MARKRELITVVGEGRYCWLKYPDVEFEDDGVYRTQILIPRDEAEPVIARLDKLADESVEAARRENPGKEVCRVAPYKEEYDEEGKPIIVLKLKTAAKFRKNNGEVVDKKLPAFDSKGNRIPDDHIPNVYTGTRLRVCITPSFYYVAGQKTAGLSLYLVSFQILKLVTYENDANYFGFTSEEGGYIASLPPSEFDLERVSDPESF